VFVSVYSPEYRNNPLGGKIIAIADTFRRMNTYRSYRKEVRTINKAFQKIMDDA
jgi:HD-GYP domain-containing protein (c-di-GMP phosphodiesterase class II)